MPPLMTTSKNQRLAKKRAMPSARKMLEPCGGPHSAITLSLVELLETQAERELLPRARPRRRLGEDVVCRGSVALLFQGAGPQEPSSRLVATTRILVEKLFPAVGGILPGCGRRRSVRWGSAAFLAVGGCLSLLG